MKTFRPMRALGHPGRSRVGRLAAGLGVITTAALSWIVFATATFAWAPLIVSGGCSDDGVHIDWLVRASRTEPDLGIDFSTNQSFTNYSSYALNSSTLSVRVETSASITSVWVRWSDDHRVVTAGYSGPCETPTPTPTPTPEDTPTPTPPDTALIAASHRNTGGPSVPLGAVVLLILATIVVGAAVRVPRRRPAAARQSSLGPWSTNRPF